MQVRNHLKRLCKSACLVGSGSALGWGLHSKQVKSKSPSFSETNVTNSTLRTCIESDPMNNTQDSSMPTLSVGGFMLYQAMSQSGHLSWSDMLKDNQQLQAELAVTLVAGVPLLFTIFRQSWMKCKEYRNWKKRQHFYRLINVQLCSLKVCSNFPLKNGQSLLKHSGVHLSNHTILESKLTEVIPNQAGLDCLIQAAEQTSVNQPFIRMSETHHSTHNNDALMKDFEHSLYYLIRDWFFSRLCGRNALTFDANWSWDDRDHMNRRFQREPYVMALLVWPWMGQWNRKIRVFLIRERMLKEVLNLIWLHRSQELGYLDNHPKQLNRMSLDKMIKHTLPITQEEWNNLLLSGIPDSWNLIRMILLNYQNQFGKLPVSCCKLTVECTQRMTNDNTSQTDTRELRNK